jgi:hypothetical protein
MFLLLNEALCRASLWKNEEIKRLIQGLLDKGHIGLDSLPCGSSRVLVAMKDNTWIMSLD